MPSHKSRYPLLLDGLQHETSREQLHKQSRPETASDYNVDKTTGAQAHVSRKRKQFIHEVVTRCVTRYMGNRNNSDGKTSLKR